jgi:pyruvate-formate lyase
MLTKESHDLHKSAGESRIVESLDDSMDNWLADFDASKPLEQGRNRACQANGLAVAANSLADWAQLLVFSLERPVWNDQRRFKSRLRSP